MHKNCSELFAVRRVDLFFLGVVVFVHVLMAVIVNLWLFPSKILNPIHLGTGGLLSVTLLANWMMLAVMLLLLKVGGGLKLHDLGLDAKKIPAAVFWFVVVWIVINLVLWVFQLSSGEALVWSWGNQPASKIVGRLIGQLFGNALYEELLFRGFLLIQLVLIFKKRFRKWSWLRSLLLALVISQLIFALIHIPNRIFKGSYVSVAAIALDQASLLMGGLFFATLWLLSRNLLVAVGLHALVNSPSCVLEIKGNEPAMAVVLLVIPALIVVLRRRERSG